MPTPSQRTPAEETDSIDSRHRLLLEEASAQLQFNNYKEAEAALEEIPGNSVFYHYAQLRLLAIDHDLSRFDQGVRRALRLIEDFGVESVPLVTVVNCLLPRRRFAEALELVRKHHYRGMGDSSGLYDLACIESNLGHFGAALRHLERSLEASELYDTWALFDFHLLPLWRHLGRSLANDLGPRTRHCLASPVFRRVLKVARQQDRFLPIDHEALHALPTNLRSLFQVRFQSGRFHIFHQTRAEKPVQFRRVCAWQRRRILTAAAALERAIRIAANPATHPDPAVLSPRDPAR